MDLHTSSSWAVLVIPSGAVLYLRRKVMRRYRMKQLNVNWVRSMIKRRRHRFIDRAINSTRKRIEKSDDRLNNICYYTLF